jgi:hypothetical protein
MNEKAFGSPQECEDICRDLLALAEIEVRQGDQR